MESRQKEALFERLTLARIMELVEVCIKNGLDTDLLHAMIANETLIIAGVNAMKSLHRASRRKSDRPIGQELCFTVPEHLGKRLYAKAHGVEGWYPGRELRLAPNTERTHLLNKDVRCRLIPKTFHSFHGPETIALLQNEGVGGATLEQMLAFAIAYPEIVNDHILMAPGTMSADADGFDWCFPSLRTWYPMGSAERILDLDLITGCEVLLLGICQD